VNYLLEMGLMEIIMKRIIMEQEFNKWKKINNKFRKRV
jgi:hypothetical protein